MVTRTNSSLLLLIALALIGAGLWMRFGGESEVASTELQAHRSGARKDEAATGPRPHLTLASETINLGTVSQCDGAKVVDVVLTNGGTVPVIVTGWISSCGCISVLEEPGFSIEAGAIHKLPLQVDAWGIGGKSHRIDFRLDGNALGARLRVDYTIDSPIRSRPSVAMRPDLGGKLAVEFERSAADGAHIDEPFTVLGVIPPVATIYTVAEGEEPIAAGWAGIVIDFAQIDDLARLPDAENDPSFDWKVSEKGRKWRSCELRIRTDSLACDEIRLRVRNN